LRAGQFYAVINPAFTGVVGGQGELHKFFTIGGGVPELALKPDDVSGSCLDVLFGIQKILDFVTVRCTRHHLHEPERSTLGIGLDSESGLTPNERREHFPVPAYLPCVFLDQTIVRAYD